jgi:hypothetical protein
MCCAGRPQSAASPAPIASDKAPTLTETTATSGPQISPIDSSSVPVSPLPFHRMHYLTCLKSMCSLTCCFGQGIVLLTRSHMHAPTATWMLLSTCPMGHMPPTCLVWIHKSLKCPTVSLDLHPARVGAALRWRKSDSILRRSSSLRRQEAGTWRSTASCRRSSFLLATRHPTILLQTVRSISSQPHRRSLSPVISAILSIDKCFHLDSLDIINSKFFYQEWACMWQVATATTI